MDSVVIKSKIVRDNLVMYFKKEDGTLYFSWISMQSFFVKDLEKRIESKNCVQIPGTIGFFVPLQVVIQESYRFPEQDKDNILADLKTIDDNIDSYAEDLKNEMYEYTQVQNGVQYDFLSGLRVKAPKHSVTTVTDPLTGYSRTYTGSFQTPEKYFIPWSFQTVNERQEVIAAHDLSLKGKKIIIQSSEGIGDVLAWLPSIVAFGQEHQVGELYTGVTPSLLPVLKEYYKNLPCLKLMPAPINIPMEDIYACYLVGTHLPLEYQRYLSPYPLTGVTLEQVPVKQLGTQGTPIHLEQKNRSPIKDPYVCINTMSTQYSKNWNNPTGWRDTISYLNSLGYTVVCVEIMPCVQMGRFTSVAPGGCIDFIGDIPLQDRIDLFAEADFFIGISSGMSWLARAAGCPTIMIGGFTDPNNEYKNPYRVYNPHVCSGCFTNGDPAVNKYKYGFCKHLGTEEEHVCSKAITAQHVKRTIQQLMSDYDLDPKINKRRKYCCSLKDHLPDKF